MQKNDDDDEGKEREGREKTRERGMEVRVGEFAS